MMTSTDHYLARMELCSGHGAADRGGQDQDPALRLHERDAVFVDGASATGGCVSRSPTGSVPRIRSRGRRGWSGAPRPGCTGNTCPAARPLLGCPHACGSGSRPGASAVLQGGAGGPVVTPFALKQVARQCAQIRPWRGEIAQIGSIASTERDFRLRVGSSRSIPILALSQAALEMLREAGLKPTSKDPVAVSPDLSLFAERTAGEILWRATGEEQWRPLGR